MARIPLTRHQLPSFNGGVHSKGSLFLYLHLYPRYSKALNYCYVVVMVQEKSRLQIFCLLKSIPVRRQVKLWSYVLPMDYQCVVIYTIVNISSEQNSDRFQSVVPSDTRYRNGCLACVFSRLKRYIVRTQNMLF